MERFFLYMHIYKEGKKRGILAVKGLSKKSYKILLTDTWKTIELSTLKLKSNGSGDSYPYSYENNN